MAYGDMSPLVTLSGKQFSALRGPVVYLWKRGDVLLYVGKCKNGLKRLSDWKAHHIFREVGDMYNPKTDSFEIFGPFKTERDALIYEAGIISVDGPYYNDWPHDWSYSGNTKPIEWDYGKNKGYRCKRCNGWVRKIPYNIPDTCDGWCNCSSRISPPCDCPCRKERMERDKATLVR